MQKYCGGSEFEAKDFLLEQKDREKKDDIQVEVTNVWGQQVFKALLAMAFWIMWYLNRIGNTVFLGGMVLAIVWYVATAMFA